MSKITKQSRAMIYLSIFLAGCVILSTILLIVNTKEPTNPMAVGLAIGVIVLALLSVGFVIYKRRKSGAAKLLDQEYYTAYETIGDTLAASPMSQLERKEVQNDVLALFIDAQNNGRAVSDVTAGNVAEFVERIQDSFGYRSKWFFHFLNGIQYSVAYIFMVQFFMWMEQYREVTFFETVSDISMMVLLLPAAFIVVPLLRYFVKKQKMALIVVAPIGLMGLFIAFAELSRANWMHVPAIKWLLDGQLQYVPSWWYVLLWIGLFILAGVLKYVQRKISIHKL